MEGVGSPPDQSSGSFFTLLMISMAGIASTTIAIVAYHLFIVKYWMRWRQRATSSGLESLPNFEISSGFDQKVLLTIPILSYSTKDCKLFRDDQSECVICLGELEDADMVRLLRDCRHAFHVPCIDNWFSGHSNCPVCRSPVVETRSRRSTSDHRVALRINHDRNEEMIQSSIQFHLTTTASDGSPLSPRVAYSTDVLGHSASTVLPIEGKQPRVEALQRSLSMDPFYYNIVNLQRESCKGENQESCSSSWRTILRVSRSYTARSTRQLNRMSARLVRSFSPPSRSYILPH